MEYLEKISYTHYKRFCKTLELENDPQKIKDYKRIHSKGQAWTEIAEGMKEIGILDMEIYLFGTRLFMIMDTVPDFDHEEAMKELSNKPRQKEWEKFVSQFQKTSANATADEKWQLIERIYKLGE